MYRTIVVGTDCSPTAALAVQKAADLARLTGAKLYLVSAYSESVAVLAASASGSSVIGHDWPNIAIDEQTAQVHAMAHQLRAQGIDVDTRIEHGTAAAVLVSVAEDIGADLLVVGGRGLKGVRGVLGSVPNRVTHRAHTDVLVVHTT
jgi:nucleotide-binding universal stress UspA family protein